MSDYNISNAICDELKKYYSKNDLFNVDEFYNIITTFNGVKSFYDGLFIPNTNRSEWLLLEIICDQNKTYLISDDEFVRLLETICKYSNRNGRKSLFKLILDDDLSIIKDIKYYDFNDAKNELMNK